MVIANELAVVCSTVENGRCVAFVKGLVGGRFVLSRVQDLFLSLFFCCDALQCIRLPHAVDKERKTDSCIRQKKNTEKLYLYHMHQASHGPSTGLFQQAKKSTPRPGIEPGSSA